MKFEEIKKEYQRWHKEDDKLEKTKSKRVLQALLIFALLYIFIFITSSTSELEKITDIFGLIIISIVMSGVDLWIHTVVYSFTLMKNQEDSIHLEYWRRRIEEKESRLAEDK